MADGDAFGERRVPSILLRLVGDDDDARHAFRLELAGEGGHVERARQRLAAGGRGRIVVEDLERDADVRRHRGANGEQSRVVVRAVAHVGEDVLGVGERRVADPRGALRAHRRKDLGAGEDVGRHEVAAHAGDRLAAFGHAGRAVVRAAGAEIGNAPGVAQVAAQLRRQRRLGERVFLGLQPGRALLDPRARVEALAAARRSPARPAPPLSSPVGGSSHSLGPLSSSRLPSTRGRRASGQ